MLEEVVLIVLIYLLTAYILILSWQVEKYYSLWRREVLQKRRMNRWYWIDVVK